MRYLKKIGFVCLGVLGFLALLSSIAASSVTNQALMEKGFLTYADTAHLSVPASRYTLYAAALSEYLDGKTETVQVPSPEDSTLLEDAFSEKENLHLQDVRGIVSFLKGVRWVGGGLAAAVIAGLYLFSRREKRGALLSQVVQGFAYGGMLLLALAAAVLIWGCIDFNGLFRALHQLVFANDLWLLNPATDLLMALMPLEFFVWYATELLKSLLPVLGMMLLVIIAWFKVGRKEA